MTKIPIVPDYNLIAAEFALGRVLAVTPLAGGAPDVAKLTATYGVFVVKPGHDRTSVELYARVASVLNTAGIRQAVPRQTLTGSAISASGYMVQEFLPGRICLDPAAAQIAATMRHIAEYHEALKKLPPPAALRVADSIWKRAASSEHLLGELPGLLRDPQIWSGPDRPPELLPVVETALGLLRGSLPTMDRLPRQLVHGDIGPDNVLMNGGHGSSCPVPGAPIGSAGAARAVGACFRDFLRIPVIQNGQIRASNDCNTQQVGSSRGRHPEPVAGSRGGGIRLGPVGCRRR